MPGCPAGVAHPSAGGPAERTQTVLVPLHGLVEGVRSLEMTVERRVRAEAVISGSVPGAGASVVEEDPGAGRPRTRLREICEVGALQVGFAVGRHPRWVS